MRGGSLRRTIMGLYALIVFSLVIFMSLLMYSTFTGRYVDETIRNYEYIAAQVMDQLDYYFSDLKSTLQIVGFNQAVTNALAVAEAGSAESPAKQLAFQRELDAFLNSAVLFKPDIKNLIILRSDGRALATMREAVRSDYNFFDKPYFPAVGIDDIEIRFVGPHVQDYYLGGSIAQSLGISAVYPIASPNSKTLLGAAMATLNLSKIAELASRPEHPLGEHFFLFDADGKTVYRRSAIAWADDALGQIHARTLDGPDAASCELAGREYELFHARSRVNGWTIVSLVPMAKLTQAPPGFGRRVALVLVFCLVIVLAASYVISRKLNGPIADMIGKMERIERGDFAVKLRDERYREIATLSARIDTMIVKVRQLIDQVYEAKLLQRETELSALQGTINPHFIFNSLQVIKSLAVLERTEDIGGVVMSLGFLLRYATGKGHGIVVTVEDELEHIRHDLELQIHWLHRGCRAAVDVDAALYPLRMPRLTLQPIVENAFQHGFSVRPSEENRVTVRGRIEDGRALIEVEDNGAGMSVERLLAVRASLHREAPFGESIGLSNVNRRLRLLHEGCAFLEIDSAEGRGTLVRIVLPMSGEGRR